MKLCRTKITRDEIQLEPNLTTAVKDNKKHFYEYGSKKGGLRISLLYWMWGETLGKDEEKLRCLMPSFASVCNSRTCCSPGSQTPEQEERDGEQK